MQVDSAHIADSIDLFVRYILDHVIVLAAIATTTMALLELVKALFRLRYVFHRWCVEPWVRDPFTLSELVILSASDVATAGALFDQPADKMIGQIQSAANVAVDFPSLYPNFYTFLTRVPRSALMGEGLFPTALGRTQWGDAPRLWPVMDQRRNVSAAGHSDYWGGPAKNINSLRNAAREIRAFIEIGAIPPRSTAPRVVPSRTITQSRKSCSRQSARPA